MGFEEERLGNKGVFADERITKKAGKRLVRGENSTAPSRTIWKMVRKRSAHRIAGMILR
jgi:hypothetical protein